MKVEIIGLGYIPKVNLSYMVGKDKVKLHTDLIHAVSVSAALSPRSLTGYLCSSEKVDSYWMSSMTHRGHRDI